jgi:hypothetical protein
MTVFPAKERVKKSIQDPIKTDSHVIPAKAGIHVIIREYSDLAWLPACAGMTVIGWYFGSAIETVGCCLGFKPQTDSNFTRLTRSASTAGPPAPNRQRPTA